MNRLRLLVPLVAVLIGRVAHAGTAYTVCATGADYMTCPACLAAITTGAGDSCLFCDQVFVNMCGTTAKGTFTLAPNVAGGAHRAVDTSGNITPAHPTFAGLWNGVTGCDKWINPSGEYLQIDGFEIYGCRDWAIYVFRSKISNVYVHDIDSDSTGGAIDVRTGSANFYNPMLSNTIVDAGAGTLTPGAKAYYGVRIEAALSRVDTIDGLTVFGAANHGLYIEYTAYGYVARNVLAYGNGADGVAATTGHNCLHITSVGNASDGIVCPTTRWSISASNVGRGICATTLEQNNVWGNGSPVGACTALDGDSIATDPAFVDTGVDDYRLCDTSAAVGVASTSTVTTDLAGSARTDPEDPGCYEPAESCGGGGSASEGLLWGADGPGPLWSATGAGRIYP